ncbi:hypothetical protein BJ165DRAFT_1032607 [Panaeolus papilionaceus]|nr:hypothetical protein BJ165DRAFT_1032607 [Panaeolus papilionaceus]
MALSSVTPREYTIEESGAPLLVTTLFISSNIPSHVPPTYTQQDQVKGNVKLVLRKAQTIKDVTFIVRGKLVYGSSFGPDVGPRILWFYQRKTKLWAKEDGQPTNSDSPDIPSQVPPSSNASGKLQGTYIWNFSVSFPPPSQILRLRPINGKEHDKPEFRLPHTFQEAHTHCHVSYFAYVELHRGGFSSDQEITIPINYIPVIIPPPIPHLRQMAYHDGDPILGPSIDPDGWTAVEPVRIKGKLFQKRLVEVTCKLYIANPLSYTRGTVIPLYMELEGSDVQALDILSSPRAPIIRLKRMVNSRPESPSKNKNLSFKVLTNYSHPAVWWSNELPGAQFDRQSTKRTLQGEIHLKNNLIPTSAVGHFWIEYSVIVLPSSITGFESTEINPEKPLVEKRVEIVTVYAPGVRPKRMAPVSYDESQDALQSKDITLRNKITL